MMEFGLSVLCSSGVVVSCIFFPLSVLALCFPFSSCFVPHHRFCYCPLLYYYVSRSSFDTTRLEILGIHTRLVVPRLRVPRLRCIK